MLKAAIFASGSGTNFEAIVEAHIEGVEIALMVCDVHGAKVIDQTWHKVVGGVTKGVRLESGIRKTSAECPARREDRLHLPCRLYENSGGYIV